MDGDSELLAISLFSGVGGFEIGFERAGIQTALQVECDPWCLAVLERHWPGVPKVSDVRSIWLEREPEGRAASDSNQQADHQRWREAWTGLSSNPDLIFGGFPCQDVSVAGRRAGLGGERSGLWFEFHRVLSELRPRWAVIENVPGLLSSRGGRDFGTILAGLDELGFAVAWAVLDAQHFGVPQRRRRLFLVAGPERRACEQVLALCESCGGHPQTRRAAGQSVAYSLAASARGTGDGHGNGWNSNYVTAEPVTASYAKQADSSDRNAGPVNLLLAVSANQRGELRWRSVHGSLNSSKSGKQFDGIQHGYGVRRLTPLECERLMGWPDDWTRWTADGREIADSHRYRMIGNGVVATVAEWIGHRLMEVDRLMRQANGR